MVSRLHGEVQERKRSITGDDEPDAFALLRRQACKGPDGELDALFPLEAVDAKDELLLRPEMIFVGCVLRLRLFGVDAWVDDSWLAALEGWENA
jgi:hypothetical protein